MVRVASPRCHDGNSRYCCQGSSSCPAAQGSRVRLCDKCVLIEVDFRGRDEGRTIQILREPRKPTKQRHTIARDLRALKATVVFKEGLSSGFSVHSYEFGPVSPLHVAQMHPAWEKSCTHVFRRTAGEPGRCCTMKPACKKLCLDFGEGSENSVALAPQS